MIRALPKEIAAKIAAGEVVERPLSIVKELIENAVDAGATAITCEIRKGGKEYIRVTDNGRGIPSGEVELAFMRYATSKIAAEEDLNAIATLGFRGEALASIAAVSRVELVTKPRDQKTGTRIRLEGGEVQEITEAACEEGTTIVVTDLFFNTPARRKFLKPDNSEASLITDYFSKMALAYPGIRFRLISGGTIQYATMGKGDLKQTILTLYSPQMAKGLVEVKGAGEEGMSLSGFVSSPSYSRNNKRMQIFFVNGRWVKSRVMEDALEEAFSDKLFEGRHPAAFLFLQVDPHAVDVNIHPHKTEIRFYDERTVSDFLVRSVRRSLLSETAIPDSISIAKPAEGESSEREEVLTDVQKSSEIKAFGYVLNGSDIPLTDKKTQTANLFARMREERVDKGVQEEIAPYGESILPGSIQKAESASPKPRFLFSSLTLVGEAFATYLIAKDEEKLYLIDQHAAHERVLYEKLLRRFNGAETAAQPLLTPILLQMTPARRQVALDKLQLLEDLGFLLEEFGTGDLILREIPSCMTLQEAEDFAVSVLEQDNVRASDLQLKRQELTSNACKAAIKGGDRIDMAEMKELMSSLDACENPFSCPHGRPTLISFSLSDIERQFKRK